MSKPTWNNGGGDQEHKNEPRQPGKKLTFPIEPHSSQEEFWTAKHAMPWWKQKPLEFGSAADHGHRREQELFPGPQNQPLQGGQGVLNQLFPQKVESRAKKVEDRLVSEPNPRKLEERGKDSGGARPKVAGKRSRERLGVIGHR